MLEDINKYSIAIVGFWGFIFYLIGSYIERKRFEKYLKRIKQDKEVSYR